MVPVPGLFLLGLPWADDESGIERSRRAHVPRPSYAGMSRRTKWRAAICEISCCKKTSPWNNNSWNNNSWNNNSWNNNSWNNNSWNNNKRNGGANSRVAPHFEWRRGGNQSEFAKGICHARRLFRCEDVNWFVRATRVAPVIAGAALVGGMIGGFAMFAIDSALTWEPSTRESASPPRSDARAEGPAGAVVAQTQTMKPARIVGGAAAAAQRPTRWPDALPRAHQNPANAANAASAQQQTAPPPGSEGAASKNGDADRKAAKGDRAAMTGDQD